MIDFRLHDVPMRTLIAFLEAVASHPNQDKIQIALFSGYSESTARKTLPTLQSLNLIESDDQGKYSPVSNIIYRGIDETSARLVIRKALHSYRPFEALCEGLALGERSDDAARKAALLLNIDLGEITRFDLLVKWGQELGILDKDDKGIIHLSSQLIDESETKVAIINITDVESEAKSRLYNALRLGRGANNFLDEIDRQLLAEALLSYRSDPKGSVEKSGQAVEDFLREVARDKGLDAEAKKLNGAGQLANLLVSKGLIHSHQQKVIDAVATIRNATAHHKDRKTLSPWEITEFTAFWSFGGAITAIRSLYEFVYEGRQTL